MSAPCSKGRNRKGCLLYTSELRRLPVFGKQNCRFRKKGSHLFLFGLHACFSPGFPARRAFFPEFRGGLIPAQMDDAGRENILEIEDGLQSNQFNFRSSLQASDGKFYFGGVNGFNCCYPFKLSINKVRPRCV